MVKNTLSRGQTRVLVFKSEDAWHAAALELNIVESGNDPREVMLLLDEAIRGYLETVGKEKLSTDLLNQSTDPEYEALWTGATKDMSSVPSVYSANIISLPALEQSCLVV